MPWAQFTLTDINFCVNLLGGSTYNVPTVEFCLVVSQFYVSLLLTMQSIKIGTKFRDRGTRQGGHGHKENGIHGLYKRHWPV